MCVCVRVRVRECVCVCVNERERETHTHTERHPSSDALSRLNPGFTVQGKIPRESAPSGSSSPNPNQIIPSQRRERPCPAPDHANLFLPTRYSTVHRATDYVLFSFAVFMCCFHVGVGVGVGAVTYMSPVYCVCTIHSMYCVLCRTCLGCTLGDGGMEGERDE